MTKRDNNRGKFEETEFLLIPVFHGCFWLLFLGLVTVWVFNVPAFAQGSVATPDRYMISVGDELELDILDDSEPPQRFIIGGDGNMQLPYVGRLQVASLTVGEARDAVRRIYMEREIFVDPGVELSIASFRPISVLGDVREPGNYDYQTYTTAEQAVGLAGGVAISADNEEARVLERRSLEGALNSLQFDLALASARLARARAQLAGREAIEWTDLPVDLRAWVNREMFNEHKPDEDTIIVIDARDFSTRRAMLEDAVAEAARRAELLDQREALLVQQVEIAGMELQRVGDLTERGLIAHAQLTTARGDEVQAENALLQLREDRSEALVQAAELKRELSQFDAVRERELRMQSQNFNNEVNKLVASRNSLEDRLRLLRQWMNAANSLDAELLVEYRVRRRSQDGLTTVKISASETLLPGDTLLITVKPPEGLERMQ